MVRLDAVAVARWGAVVVVAGVGDVAVAGVGNVGVEGDVGGDASVLGAVAGGVWCERRVSLSHDDERRGDVTWFVWRRVGAWRE